MTSKYVLAVGSAMDCGIRLFGLFNTENEAITWARNNPSNYITQQKFGTTWEVVQITLNGDVQ